MLKLTKNRRGSAAQRQHGDYMLIDTAAGRVVRSHVDLEAFAREKGALKPWEEMAKDDAPKN